MKSRSFFCALMFLTLCVQVHTSCGQPAGSNTASVISGLEPGRSVATSSAGEEAMVDEKKRTGEDAATKMTPVSLQTKEEAMNGGVQRDETRAQRATRVNRSIFITARSVLGFFILCRLWLLRQMAQYRKSIARANTIEQ